MTQEKEKPETRSKLEGLKNDSRILVFSFLLNAVVVPVVVFFVLIFRAP